MVEFIKGDDGEVKAERCVPMLDISMNIDENVGMPDKRIELETELQERLGYIERRIFSTVRSGPAVHENIRFYVELDTAEFWSSIDRKVQNLKEWAKKDDRIDDIGRDLGITLEAGDPEMIVREAEEGFSR